jgi:hypothetical protein
MKYIKTFENFGSYPDIEFAEQIANEILPELKRRKYNGEKITVDSFENEMKEKYPSAFKNNGSMFDTILHIIVDKGYDIGFEFDIETEDGEIIESTSLTKTLRKLGWFGEDWTPQDFKKQIRNLSDSTLLLWYNSKDTPIPNTPLDFQLKLVKLEVERRGLKK